MILVFWGPGRAPANVLWVSRYWKSIPLHMQEWFTYRKTCNHLLLEERQMSKNYTGQMCKGQVVDNLQSQRPPPTLRAMSNPCHNLPRNRLVDVARPPVWQLGRLLLLPIIIVFASSRFPPDCSALWGETSLSLFHRLLLSLQSFPSHNYWDLWHSFQSPPPLCEDLLPPAKGPSKIVNAKMRGEDGRPAILAPCDPPILSLAERCNHQRPGPVNHKSILANI